MGAQGSALLGKAQPCHDTLLPFTEWQLLKVQDMRARHIHDLGSSFALTHRQLEVLLDVRRAFANDDLPAAIAKSAALFALFDTDNNKLVDCYEVMVAMVLLAETGLQAKVDFVHSLFDFNGTGEVTFDEMVLLLRTAAVAGHKVDPRVEVPGTAELESLATVAFTSAGKAVDKEVTKFELDRFCFGEPRVREFLDYFSGGLNEVALGKAEFFRDDQAFPADASSLFTRLDHTPIASTPASAVSWLRPSKFVPGSPLLLGPTMADGHLVPGQLSDLYFLKALGMMLAQPSLIRKLFLATRQEAQGRYCVQVYKEGNWSPVFVDDRIPCNVLGKPAYSTSSDANDVWVPLVEKAYAKLHGCYEAIAVPDSVVSALRDLTGCPVQRLSLRDNEAKVRFESGDLWTDIQTWTEQGLLGCMATDSQRCMSARQGIILHHMYSVLKTTERRGLKLVQLKNVFGQGRLSHNPWCRESSSWDAYRDVYMELGMDGLPDHVFWVEYSSFLSLFDHVTVCWLLKPPQWRLARRFGQWEGRGGGCFTHPTWPQNPQVFLKVSEGLTLVVNLTQQDPKFHGAHRPLAAVGLALLQHDYDEAAVAAGMASANVKRWRKVQLKCLTPTLSRQRDVFLRVFLPKGKYAIVPMTSQPGVSGTFWVSLYYDKPGLKVFGGGACRDVDELCEASRHVSADLDTELMESSGGPLVDFEDPAKVGLAALAGVVDAMWDTVRELQVRNMVLEEALGVGLGVGRKGENEALLRALAPGRKGGAQMVE